MTTPGHGDVAKSRRPCARSSRHRIGGLLGAVTATALLTAYARAEGPAAEAPASLPAAAAPAQAAPATQTISAPTAAPSAPPAATSHADAGGINWFRGDVAAAFAAARAAHKPVFLYWGAKWCPPCQQLKSSVFSRSDFIEKSKQFVAVYLDGDDPGAQKWGAAFHVSGYPTVVMLRADQREIMRLMGGTDLAQYADVLDIALHDVSPITQVVARLRNGGQLSRGDCQRLSYNGWVWEDYREAQSKALARDLERAASLCTGLTPTEHAQLLIASASLAVTPESLGQVIAIVEDENVAPQVAGDLEVLVWTKPFVDALRARETGNSATFLAAWSRTMDTVAEDPKVIDAEQLAALAAKLAMIKELAPDHAIPPAAATQAKLRMALALGKKSDPYVRAGVVNSASNINDLLGDENAEYALLTGELATARSPYYYMLDLGELEEKRGHVVEALGWYERAFRESQGIATRFAWGTEYLSALLRLAPTDHARIREVGLVVLAELDGPDRLQARSRVRLEKLDGKLREWNAQHRYDADIQALRARMEAVCGKIPDGDTSRGACRKFLS